MFARTTRLPLSYGDLRPWTRRLECPVIREQIRRTSMLCMHVCVRVRARTRRLKDEISAQQPCTDGVKEQRSGHGHSDTADRRKKTSL
jgi:hypothetical protein